MTDQDAILEAVFAAPADDAPRLVYADWLDENGHPEQAEFIRQHIELFRTPDEDYVRLARAATLEASWNHFKIELMESLPHTEVRLDLYARGLPEHEHPVLADQFLLDAPRWWPVFPVRKLVLARWIGRAWPVSQCAYLTRVTDLTLAGDRIETDVARLLINSPVLANVRRLSFLFTSIADSAARALKEHFGTRLQGVS